MKKFMIIFLGTLCGQLLFKYVIEPKLDECDKNKEKD